MAKKKENKGKIKWGKILMWVVGLILILILIYSKVTSGNSGTFVRFGNPLSVSTKEFVFNSCGSRLPQYKYSVFVPNNLSIYRTSYDLASTYYEVKGKDVLFTISCTNQGVGGDICDEKYRITFIVNNKEYEACFGVIDGRWNMGVLNLSTDPKTNATVSFWSDGLDRNEIDNILSTYKLIGNQ